MVDRVQAVKWESPGQGGTQEDMVPTEIDVNEDGLDARGLFIQDDSSSDKKVFISRDASGNMTFQDDVVPGIKTLADLLAAAIAGHPFKVDSGETLTITEDRQFDHLGRFPVDGRLVINGRFVLGIGALNG